MYPIFKRVFDIMASGLALLVLSPVLAVIVWRIKRFDGSPVLLRGTSLGIARTHTHTHTHTLTNTHTHTLTNTHTHKHTHTHTHKHTHTHTRGRAALGCTNSDRW